MYGHSDSTCSLHIPSGNKLFWELMGLAGFVHRLVSDGEGVEIVEKGDTEPQFDWRLTLEDGSVLGLEVVTAEDEHVRGNHERALRNGESFDSSVLTAWDAATLQVGRKSEKLPQYREGLPKGGAMFLVVAPGVAAGTPVFESDSMHEDIRNQILEANGGFDGVYIMDVRHLPISMTDGESQRERISHHLDCVGEGTEVEVPWSFVRRLPDGMVVSCYAPLSNRDDVPRVRLAVHGEPPTLDSNPDERFCELLEGAREPIQVGIDQQRWELPIHV